MIRAVQGVDLKIQYDSHLINFLSRNDFSNWIDDSHQNLEVIDPLNWFSYSDRLLNMLNNFWLCSKALCFFKKNNLKTQAKTFNQVHFLLNQTKQWWTINSVMIRVDRQSLIHSGQTIRISVIGFPCFSSHTVQYAKQSYYIYQRLPQKTAPCI